MWEEIEGLMHLKVFLPTRPVTLIKDITSPCKSCFNSKHSTFLWGLCGTDTVQCNLNLAPSTQGFLMQSPPEGIRGAHGDMHDWKAAHCCKWSTELERWKRDNFMTKQDMLRTQVIPLFLIQPDSVMLGKTFKLNFAKWALQCYLLHKSPPLGLVILFEKCWGSARPLRSQICFLDSHKNSLYISVFRIH